MESAGNAWRCECCAALPSKSLKLLLHNHYSFALPRGRHSARLAADFKDQPRRIKNYPETLRRLTWQAGQRASAGKAIGGNKADRREPLPTTGFPTKDRTIPVMHLIT